MVAMTDIRKLYELQTVDLELDRRTERLAQIRAALADNQRLADVRTATTAAKQRQATLEHQQRELDAEVAGFNEHIKAVEAKLYSGTITSSKELTSLQADVEQLRKQRSGREEQLLTAMGELEQAQATHRDAAQRLVEEERVWAASRDGMLKEKATLEQETARFTAERDARASGAGAADLAVYEHVRRTHKGRAVARMRNGTCESCRVGLPLRQALAVRGAAVIIRCPNCGLILLGE